MFFEHLFVSFENYNFKYPYEEKVSMLNKRILKWVLFLILQSLVFLISCESGSKEKDLFNLNWKKNKNNPIFKPAVYSWDSKQVLVGTVLKQDRQYLMWYYGTGNDRKFSIGIAESSNGIKWRRKVNSPILTAGSEESWDSYRVSCPFVIREQNFFKMWYLGEVKEEGKMRARIGIATSDNGITWRKSEQNPVFDLTQHDLSWAYFLRSFWIIKEDSLYKMWFSAVGKEKFRSIESIGYAHSLDGLSWKIYEKPVLQRDTTSIWEDFYVSNPMVIKANDHYYMFYGGMGRFGYLFKENIGIAISANGIKWIKNDQNPILVGTDNSSAWDREFVTQPRVMKINDGKFYMWYVGADEKNTLDSLGNYQIGLSIGKYK